MQKNNNQPPQITITPAMMETVKDTPFISCVVCGGTDFISVVRFKTIPALLTGSAQPLEAVMMAYVCKTCNHTRGIPAPEKA